MRRAAALPLLASLLVVLGLGGCSRGGGEAADAGDAGRTEDALFTAGLPSLRDLNVLLIGIDTLGAQHVSCYDTSLATTPRLDALATGGVRFARAFTPAPWTQPAFASLFTGRMPSDCGVLRLFDALPPEEETIAELLAAEGHRTAGVFSHVLLAAPYGFAQGFETYDNESAVDYRAITSAHVTDRALARLRKLAGVTADGAAGGTSGGRFFLFVHYFDPHYAYMQHTALHRTVDYHGPVKPGMRLSRLREIRARLGAEDVAFLRMLHREDVTFTDREIGRLLDGLGELGLADSTLVIVAGDHGEELMEHGWIGHVATLREELLHVPLIVSLPGVLEPRVVDAPVSLLDVLPTLAALAGRRPATGVEGRSLIPLLTGRGPAPGARDLLAEVTFLPHEDGRTAGMSEEPIFKTALRSGPFKLIHDLSADRWTLFDVAADPAEDVDLAPHDPAAWQELRARLLAWEEPRRETWFALDDSLPAVDEETLRRVRSLGYVR